MKGFSLNPERYLKDNCEWLYGSLERIRKRKGEGIYFASSYEKRLRRASATVCRNLGLKDRRVFEHIIHWVMTDCGMNYNAVLNDEKEGFHSTVDMRRFDPDMLEENIAKYNKPWKDDDMGHIDTRYKAAWEDENPDKPIPKLPLSEPKMELLIEVEPRVIKLTA